MEDKEDGGLALGTEINHELLASILVEEPLTSPPPSSLFEELTSGLMDSSNIDLYLECDDDKSYAVPQQQDELSLHSLLGSNVNMRISFPTPPSDVGSDEGSLSCKYCKCNFLSQNHLNMHTRTAHGETNHLNGRIKKSFSFEKEFINGGQSNGKASPPQTPGSAAALVPSLFSSGVAKKPKTLKMKRKSVKDKMKNGKHGLLIKKSKSDSEIKPQELQNVQPPLDEGKVRSEVQYESTNETIDVEHMSPVNSPSSVQMNLDLTLKKQAAGVPFTCHICMKTYVSKYALKRHIATHSDERPFICSFPDCKGAFKLKSRLTDHIRYVHKRKTARTASRSKSLPSSTSQSPQNDVQSVVDSAPPQQQGSNGFDSSGSGNKSLFGGKPSANSKTFKCSMPNCSREFRDAHNLRVHMCLHTGHQPLKCSKCDYRCIQKASLDWHVQKMHTSS